MDQIKKVLWTATLSLCSTLAVAQEGSPLWLRYPTISPDGKEVAFTYGGDIYKVSVAGGAATRLTTHKAYDNHPIWSPDGRQIAFTSDRNNAGTNIYIMPATGGAARQLTTHSSTETPYTFTRDGKQVVFKAHYQDPHTSARFPMSPLTEVYAVPVEGGRPVRLVDTPAEEIIFSADGKRFMYQNIKGFEDEWRKKHVSSVTKDILEYDMTTGKHRFIVEHDGEDRDPVYSPDGKKVYFISQRNGGDLNVYEKEIDADPKTAKALTHFKDEPVRFLSMSDGGVLCFSYAGEIYTLVPGSTPQKLSVSIHSDVETSQMTYQTFTKGFSEATVSPDGKQIAFAVRGDIFVTATDYNTTKRITNTPQAESSPTFSSDGRTLVFASDKDGRWDLYKVTISDKSESNFPNATILKEERLIKDNKEEKMHPVFSPDGKEIAFVLGRTRLAVYNLKSGAIRTITEPKDQHGLTGYMDFEWSPDSKWFVTSYVARDHAPYSDIGIVSAEGGKPIHNITNTGYFDTNPRWALDGNAIIFASERFGMRNHASWGSQSDVMAIFLNRKAYDEYRMNEEEYELYSAQNKKAEKPEEKKDDKKKKDKKKTEEVKSKDIVIEWDNIEDRIVRLTPNASELGDALITKDGKTLYYMVSFEDGYDLWSHDLRKRSTKLIKKLNQGFARLRMDKDGKHIFILSNSPQKMTVQGEALKPITYRAEWSTDLTKEREYLYSVVKLEEGLRFYEESMHGVDWEALTKRYAKYLPHISNNYDFAELLSELLGELNVSHTGSRYRAPGALKRTAELGLFVSTPKGNKDGLVIDEIISGGPFDKAINKVQPGDMIVAIDGTDIKAGMDYFPLLNGKIGQPIALTIRSAKGGQLFTQSVKGISSGAQEDLLYKRWVKQRAAEVDKLSNGRLGYVHIPSMGDPSFRTMYSEVMGRYYDREGIVIDIRYNGGGRLHEDIEVFFTGKKYLQQSIRGKDYCEMPSRRWNHASIMVTCEADYSNAHGTPWVYQKMKIGKIVGMPVPGTMTSVNWVTLQDPSLLFGIPAVGYRTEEGYYLENIQVEPDVKVSLDHDKLLRGEDTQMEAAVRTLLGDIKAGLWKSF